MGANISQLERDIGTDFPANEHYFGLVNVSAQILFFRQCFDFHIFLNPASLEIPAIAILFYKPSISASPSETKYWSTSLRTS